MSDVCGFELAEEYDAIAQWFELSGYALGDSPFAHTFIVQGSRHSAMVGVNPMRVVGKVCFQAFICDGQTVVNELLYTVFPGIDAPVESFCVEVRAQIEVAA